MIGVEVGEEVGDGETGIGLAAEGVYEETGVGDAFRRGERGRRNGKGRWWW